MPLHYRIEKINLLDLLERLAKSEKVFVPYKKEKNRLYLELFNPEKSAVIELGEIRQDSPLKAFLTPCRQELAGADGRKERVIVAGIKGCDLAGLTIQDFVFLEGGVEDPFYARRRKNLFIIAADCTLSRETCFCVAMEGHPYPVRNFDLSLAAVDSSYIVEVGSEAGQKLIDEYRTFFQEANESHLSRRVANRKRVSEDIERSIARRKTPFTSALPGVVAKNYASKIWEDFHATCVECGACNLVCPTCHCFFLSDATSSGRPARFMQWDACLYKRFARVAGGGNPRKKLGERLRNRFEKKFDFFPKVLNVYACTGCGRCIEACPGDIDIREVLKGLVTGGWDNPPND